MGKTQRSHTTFASDVFTRERMAQYLSESTYLQMIEVMDHGAKMTPELAGQVAHAMKEWAIDRGATHFTHWFQPMRGVTAEKHDSFLTLDGGVVVDRFSGSQLIQSEPDASSFPSGGMRTTFEARGYTAWDPNSPVFLAQGAEKYTLVVPSVYLSYTGEVLDLKTQVLRSSAVVEKLAFQLLKKFGNRTARWVKTTAGPEQEFFLIGRDYYQRRLDLLLTGRTLLGARAAKDQQLEDHYFGHIRPEVIAFMEEVDEALGKRGIAFKTRHNEVAPHQYEFAPTFVEGTLAVDHNLQLMDLMDRIAERHHLKVLLHEKPFFGVNGSGKHLNYSLMDSDGRNLFEPGEGPKRDVQFLTLLAAMLIGVNRYSGLLRAAVADAGNDHRLGANEAPPAIMSVFVGGYLEGVLRAIANGENANSMERATLDIRARHVPGIISDCTDRNRTSPLAFTGNKFEFRAVGSSQNIAEPLTVINLLLAAGLEEMLAKIDRFGEKIPHVKDAALAAIAEAIQETERVRFQGNNYSGDWHAEAAKRGLPGARNTPEALQTYLQEEVLALYEKNGVLNHKEIEAKVEVRREAYKKMKVLELNVLQELARTRVLPALAEQLRRYAQTEKVLVEGRGVEVLHGKVRYLSDLLGRLEEQLHKAGDVVAFADGPAPLPAVVDRLGEEGCAVLEELRAVCDQVEREVDADLWNIPKYWEMLHLF